MTLFTFPIRIYYEDTDAGGIVYYANYLKFAERARTELLREYGIEQQTLMAESGIGFVVRKCTVEFMKPAKLDDLIQVETTVSELSKVRIIMAQTISRKAEKLVSLTVEIAVVDASGKVAKLPDDVMKKLQGYT